jgi:predicted nucleic acid-binding protein
MNLVDSSGWLEYFSDGKNAQKFAEPLENLEKLLIPTIIMYEVFKVMLRESGEQEAIIAQAYMQQGSVIELSAQLAILAARLSLEHRIPMADSIILATAQTLGAIIWTEDEHFYGLKGVKYFAK